VPYDDEKKNFSWMSLWNFIKFQSNVTLIDEQKIDDKHLIFLNGLTTGRGDAKIRMISNLDIGNYDQLHHNKWGRVNFCSLDMVHEFSLMNQNVLIADERNYYEKWDNLNLNSLAKSLDVRESAQNNKFTEWAELKQYLLPSNEVLLVDRYVLGDNSLLYSNLFKIIDVFEDVNNSEYLFVIVTEGNSSPIINKQAYNSISDYISNKNYKCRLGVVFTQSWNRSKAREHDRNIITSYLRINSGDSFNYFDSRGNILTQTSISFFSHADKDNFINSGNILKDIRTLIGNNQKNTLGNSILSLFDDFI